MNLFGLIINLFFYHNFKQRLKKLKSEASVYQGNGRNGIEKQRVRHQSFYFIVRLFLKLSDYPFVKYLIFWKGLSRVEPKILQSISVTKTYHSLSGTQTDHSLLGPPKDHQPLSLHPIEPYPTDQRCLDIQK